MNFRRGLFRIWVVLSAGWIMVVGYAGDLPCAFGVTFQPLGAWGTHTTLMLGSPLGLSTSSSSEFLSRRWRSALP